MGFWLAASVYGERPTVVKRGRPCFCFICVGIFENLLFFGWTSRSQRTLKSLGCSQSSDSIAYGRVACATAEKLQHSRPGNSLLSQPRSVHIDSKTATGNPRAFTEERLFPEESGAGHPEGFIRHRSICQHSPSCRLVRRFRLAADRPAVYPGRPAVWSCPSPAVVSVRPIVSRALPVRITGSRGILLFLTGPVVVQYVASYM